MAPPTNLSHRRTHNLLLISKLLSLRDTTSPLALILDSLEQPAKPLIREYIRRAQISKTHVTFISFETLKRPEVVDAFISCRRKRPSEIAKEVANVYNQPSTPVSNGASRRRLIIIDSINPLINSKAGGAESPVHLPSFLSSLIMPSPPSATAAGPHTQTSLIVTYHQDIPTSSTPHTTPYTSPYTPSRLTLLSYMATSIFTLHSLRHILAQKAAQDRSLQPPIFGLEEQIDGVIIGHNNINIQLSKQDVGAGSNTYTEGIVIELEHRRKSGRGVLEWYFLPTPTAASPSVPGGKQKGTQHPQQQALLRETVILLDDHPLYRRSEEEEGEERNVPGDGIPEGSTFELGLTERQRKEREAVVLPYFDAQRGDGPGEGGRILYDMGEEDDFDEEEDEI